MVFLYILAIDGALVGMALGVLLPMLFPGFCFGASLALFAGCFAAMTNSYYFPIAGGILAALGAVASASARYVGGVR